MTIISNTRYLQEHNVNYQMITTFFGSYQKLTIQPLYNPSQRSGWELTCVVGLQVKDQVSSLRGFHFLSGLSYVICSQQLLHHLYDTVVFGRHLGTLQSDRFIFRTNWLFGVVRRERWISSGFNSSSGLWQSGDEGGITLYQSFDSPNHLTVACL